MAKKEQVKQKRGRALPPITPDEIRQRDVLQVGTRFKDEDKDFLADLLQEQSATFNATINDTLTILVRNARLQREQQAS